MSDKMVKITGTMNHPVYFNNLAPYDIKYKVRFNNQYPVTVFTQLNMSWNSSQQRLLFKLTNSIV